MVGHLSFPPLLHGAQWRGSTGSKHYPGGDNTWRKALAARPLKHMPDKATVRELQVSTGGRFGLLQQSIQLPDDLVKRSSAYTPFSGPGLGSHSASMPLYNSVWPGTAPPAFNVWNYCQKHGHAPPPNTLPAPRGVSDLKSWFAEYGHPKADCPPGVRTEFTATMKCVPRAEGEISKGVRMIKGSVLR